MWPIESFLSLDVLNRLSTPLFVYVHIVLIDGQTLGLVLSIVELCIDESFAVQRPPLFREKCSLVGYDFGQLDLRPEQIVQL